MLPRVAWRFARRELVALVVEEDGLALRLEQTLEQCLNARRRQAVLPLLAHIGLSREDMVRFIHHDKVQVLRLPADEGVLFKYALSALLNRKLRSIRNPAAPCPPAPIRALL